MAVEVEVIVVTANREGLASAPILIDFEVVKLAGKPFALLHGKHHKGGDERNDKHSQDYKKEKLHVL